MGTGIGEALEIIGMDLLSEGLLEDVVDIDDPDMDSDTPAAAVENDNQETGDD
jgi:hypothetical protein